MHVRNFCLGRNYLNVLYSKCHLTKILTSIAVVSSGVVRELMKSGSCCHLFLVVCFEILG